ncbi:hypothetical protein NEOLEDRAFT_1174558 [Neolentinus lepideus HHB14362 ss-1]|uniref:Uncharacterized protein n=1 Tax=Neolentinus lepideus HHB14362 ss-1 TaxID=1314782 RepID=A0A165VVG3_9AGAM|nr:hypothetical protein NEOLEDRAFT_1174558 [Neolentinus lepideus HHB14362 ss-1]
MANWLDVISFIFTMGLFVGVIIGVLYASNAISKAMANTKESLKAKGVDLSKSGMSVRTSGRYTREDYIDATQRGIIKSMSAASFRRQDPSADASVNANSNGKVHYAAPPALERRDSNASVKTTNSIGEKEKKKHLFGGLRKSHSVKEKS